MYNVIYFYWHPCYKKLKWCTLLNTTKISSHAEKTTERESLIHTLNDDMNYLSFLTIAWKEQLNLKWVVLVQMNRQGKRIIFYLYAEQWLIGLTELATHNILLKMNINRYIKFQREHNGTEMQTDDTINIGKNCLSVQTISQTRW